MYLAPFSVGVSMIFLCPCRIYNMCMQYRLLMEHFASLLLYCDVSYSIYLCIQWKAWSRYKDWKHRKWLPTLRIEL